jgi:hypothetical protein
MSRHRQGPRGLRTVADGGPDVEALLAGLPGRGEVLAPVLDPLDRPAKGVRRRRDGEFLTGSANL